MTNKGFENYLNEQFSRLHQLSMLNIKFDNKNPKLVVRMLPKLMNLYKEYKQEGQFEDAYIALKRWSIAANFLKNLKKNEDFKEYLNPESIDLNERCLKEVKLKLEHIYEENYFPKSPHNKNSNNDEISFPDIPDEEPNEKMENEITCNDLYNFLKEKSENSKIFLIDIRKTEDYNLSTVFFESVNIYNIPKDIINSEQRFNNKYFSSLKNLLMAASSAKIVLFDRNTVDQNFAETFKIWLKDIVQLKNINLINIEILCGGFDQWKQLYSEFTTKPQTKQDPQKSKKNLSFDLSNFDEKTFKVNDEDINNKPQRKVCSEKIYPNLTETSKLPNPNKSNNLSNFKPNDKIHFKSEVVLTKLDHQTVPSFDRNKKPNNLMNIDKSMIANNNLNILRDNQNKQIWDREQNDTINKFDQMSGLYPTLQDKGLTNFALKPLDKKIDKENNKPQIKENIDYNSQMEVDDINDENEFDDKNNTEMKRSYSFSDLTQKVIQTPEYDRSLKPNFNKTPERNNKFREERLDPIYLSSGTAILGITGLKNLGNSCYMNSIVQCLSNTSDLSLYFLQKFKPQDLNKKEDNKNPQFVAEEIAHIIKALWRGKYKSISPRDLKDVIGEYKAQFSSYDQQDSHEFLTFLLDWVHNDLKKECKMDPKKEPTEAEKQWEKAMGGKSSIISSLFFGQLRSTIKCVICGTQSVTYEVFNSLTLSLPSSKCTLDDCLKRYVSSQSVSGWKCTKCKAPRDATKKFDFVKLAPVVVIHLNRFGDSSGWLEKKNTAVDFPIKDLDLSPYIDHSYINYSQNYTYNLYAMSNHYGTMDGGHYTAFCKNSDRNKWYKYDDQSVSEVSANQIKNQSNSAYLLFYTSIPSNRRF